MTDATFNIDDPPDPSRPRNPWPRLLAFGVILLFGIVIFGACLVAYTRSAPARSLEVETNSLEVGLPRLLPAIPFGADRFGFTFGAWVVRAEDGQTHALLSRDPGSGCHVAWNPTTAAGGRVGVFIDPCDGSRYLEDGRVIDGPTPRGLDRFPYDIDGGTVVVDVERLWLGECVGAAGPDCSPPGEPVSRDLPSGPLR
ncbi:MAG: hypothetical protein GEU80_02220 [Dehalococcoidia bacterium]|nr:hypothetical protein [Dehalococcoidia bacterium]